MPTTETTPARLLPTVWEVPDDLWEEIEPIVDCFYPAAATGRPRADLRRVLNGIIHRLRSGCQWNYLPGRFGASSTVHGWFQRFAADGLLEEIWAYLITECEELDGVSWEWQAADGVMGKSRFDGAKRGPNLTDRAKLGTKKHVIVIQRPDPEQVPQHLCLDKAYDNKSTRRLCADTGYIAHVRRIGEEKLATHEKTQPARRWVVERTIAWLQKCRALLIRYDKNPTNYLGLIQLACALLWYRRRHQLQQHAQTVLG